MIGEVNMSLINQETKKLRNFGLLFSGIFATLGCYKVYNENLSGAVYAGLGCLFLLSALFFPKALIWPEKIWMKFGDFMSAIMTRVMLFILFFIAITPLAFIMRALGRNPLNLKLNKDAETYWEPFDKDGPGSRPFLPY